MADLAEGNGRKRRIDRLLRPIRRFMEIEASSGLILVAATLLALGLANSPLALAYQDLLHTKILLAVGSFSLSGDVAHLVINDGLMTIFFFVVGLEIKRELVQGKLSDVRSALLPMFAALGGMVVPAVVYSLLQWGQPGQNGWAIPMATDIAFVVGILTLFGDRIPIGFKVFLLSLAIVDDLASIVVIATLFSQSLSVLWLAIACVVGVSIYGLNVLGVRSVGVYTVAGFILWLSVFNSGVHPTVAGVALGLLTPTYAWVDNFRLMQIIDSICARENSSRSPELDPEKMHELSETALESISPLERLETALHPRVAFAIMPLFAFSNAGVALDVESISHPVAIAVALGCLSVSRWDSDIFRCSCANGINQASSRSYLVDARLRGCLAGIGFTMSLFINTLSFTDNNTMLDAGKIGIFMGSIVSGLVGIVMLWVALRQVAPRIPRGAQVDAGT